jgi:phosphotriesterase-related protein
LIRTVTGDIETLEGPILAHEHLQIDLSAQKGPANRVGPDEETDVIQDLRKAKQHGLAAIVDLSAPLWGRDPVALKRISEAAKLPVVYAAGFYWDPFPDIVRTGTVEAMRDTIIAEVETGADGTGIRCGVIKIGTARGTPGANEEKLFRAAAAAGMATGAAVITHTSSTDQAPWHVRVLEKAGMDMSHVVISHMGAAADFSELVEIGRSGAFMGIDKVSFPKGPTNTELAGLVVKACERGLERQLILSSDVARRTMLSRHGGNGYSAVFNDFLPMLRSYGLVQAQFDTMLCDNPRRLLTLAR